MLPDEPGVSPRSNSERPRRQISSRSLVSVMTKSSVRRVLSHALAARPSRDRQHISSRERQMPETAKPRIAVIGLGSMGFGMATSLRRAGFEVTGCDVSQDAVNKFIADGGKGAHTPAEAARAADIVVSVVVNAAQTETILFGKDGVGETLPEDAV